MSKNEPTPDPPAGLIFRRIEVDGDDGVEVEYERDGEHYGAKVKLAEVHAHTMNALRLYVYQGCQRLDLRKEPGLAAASDDDLGAEMMNRVVVGAPLAWRFGTAPVALERDREYSLAEAFSRSG